MEQTESRNHILLRGHLRELPAFSHENHGKNFYRFSLEVPRLSGAVDTLPVIAEEAVLNGMDLSGGSMITVSGQIRSHNLREPGHRRLMVFVFAQSMLAEDGEPVNEVQLNGVICREPTYRRTPLGREICDIMLAVPRAFHRADYLPCILWGKVAAEGGISCVGDGVLVNGRLQSRIYTKLMDDVAQEHTTYEISALTAQFLPREDESIE